MRQFTSCFKRLMQLMIALLDLNTTSIPDKLVVWHLAKRREPTRLFKFLFFFCVLVAVMMTEFMVFSIVIMGRSLIWWGMYVVG